MPCQPCQLRAGLACRCQRPSTPTPPPHSCPALICDAPGHFIPQAPCAAQGSLDALQAQQAAQDADAREQGPVVRLAATNATSGQRILLASNQTLLLAFGQPAPFSLLPCLANSSFVNCAATAWDPQDGDLSAAMQVGRLLEKAAVNNNNIISTTVIYIYHKGMLL